MSRPKTLKELFGTGEESLVGQVTKVTSTSVLVATNRGVKVYEVANPSSFRVGDSVRYSGDSLVGRIAEGKSLPIYSV